MAINGLVVYGVFILSCLIWWFAMQILGLFDRPQTERLPPMRNISIPRHEPQRESASPFWYGILEE